MVYIWDWTHYKTMKVQHLQVECCRGRANVPVALVLCIFKVSAAAAAVIVDASLPSGAVHILRIINYKT